jgi:hypothetical protein
MATFASIEAGIEAIEENKACVKYKGDKQINGLNKTTFNV